MALSRTQLCAAFQAHASQTRGAGGVVFAAAATHELQNTAGTTTHYAYGASGTTLGLGDDFTLAVWVHFYDFFASNRGIMGVTSFNETPANGYDNGIYVAQDTSNRGLVVRSYDNGTASNLNSHDAETIADHDANITEDTYGLLVVTYDGSANVCSVNWNGTAITDSMTDHPTLTDAADRVLFLCSPTGSTNQSPAAYIAQFGAWSRELTGAEITALAAVGNADWRNASGNYGSGAAAALVHYYVAQSGDFDHATLGLSTDLVGSHNLTGGSDAPGDGDMATITADP